MSTSQTLPSRRARDVGAAPFRRHRRSRASREPLRLPHPISPAAPPTPDPTHSNPSTEFVVDAAVPLGGADSFKGVRIMKRAGVKVDFK